MRDSERQYDLEKVIRDLLSDYIKEENGKGMENGGETVARAGTENDNNESQMKNENLNILGTSQTVKTQNENGPPASKKKNSIRFNEILEEEQEEKVKIVEGEEGLLATPRHGGEEEEKVPIQFIDNQSVLPTDPIVLDEIQFDFLSKINLDFEILHGQYIVFKINLRIYYLDLNDFCDCSLEKKDNREVKLVNIDLRDGEITQLLQTQKPHLLQFVYAQKVPSKITYIITWNLITNMEEQMLELPVKCID